MNLEIAVIAMAFSLIVGLFLALGRISKNPVMKWASGMWIDVWRNLPLIFILLYLSLALPNEAKRAWEEAAPDFLPEAFQSGQIAMDVVHTWYTCCVYPGEGTPSVTDWDIAVLPEGPDGTITSKLHADTIAIMSSTEHPDEAFEVLGLVVGRQDEPDAPVSRRGALLGHGRMLRRR